MAAPTSVRLPSLVHWRIQRNVTQAELARTIGVRRATIARIQAGNPALIKTAHRLADALDINVNDLMRQPPTTD